MTEVEFLSEELKHIYMMREGWRSHQKLCALYLNNCDMTNESINTILEEFSPVKVAETIKIFDESIQTKKQQLHNAALKEELEKNRNNN